MATSPKDRELLRAALARTPECLSAPQLEAAAAGTASTGAQAHLQACPRCQAEAALLRNFEAAEAMPDEGGGAAWIAAQLDRARPGRATVEGKKGRAGWGMAWSRFTVWSTVAAAVTFTAVALTVYWSQTRQPELRASTSRQAPVYRGSAFRTLTPAGDLTSAVVAFEWEPVPGAADYWVRVMDVDRNVLWTSKSSKPQLTAPPDLKRHATTGKMLLWQVTALDASGATIAESDLGQFRIVGGAANSH